MNRFVFAALPALAISLAAAPPATAAEFRVWFFSGGAGWVETTPPPPGASDRSSIDLSVQGSSSASVRLTGFSPTPPAISPSYDFRPSVSGPSGGSPRLTMRLSDGGGELRPVSLVADEWTPQDGSTDWDSYGGSCGFRSQLSYGEFLGCHPGAEVTGLEIMNDSGWLYPDGFQLFVDNVTYGGETISSQDTDVLRGGPAESPKVTADPSGKVLVRLPPGEGSGEFVPLEEVAEVPVGSVVDAEEGSIELSTASDTSGRFVSGDFSQGVFQILQPRRRPEDAGVTELRMRGLSRRECGSGRAQASALTRPLYANVHRKKGGHSRAAAAAASPPGGFRVRTRNSTTRAWEATWRTVDRCDGTLTRVTRGRVLLRDLHRKRSKVLRAGGRYLARVP
jgi:hypothetical protein